MIRSIYAKIFLWFFFATTVMGVTLLLVTIFFHAQSLGPRWMTGVLNQYARSAVEIYVHGGKPRLAEYLEEIEQSSKLKVTLLDPQGNDILGRGIPAGAEDVLDAARAARQTRFRTGWRWCGAAVVDRPDGDFILVANVAPYNGLGSWWALKPPAIRLAVALLSGAVLCLLLARHIAAPIRALQGVARRIADGDLSVRATPAIAPRKDELAELARDFDRMADRIESLLQKQRELLGDISHELRSPLARLGVSLELVRRGDADAIERMQADLDRLDILIGQILTLTRLQAQAGQKPETMVNLRPIVESVAEDACFEGHENNKSAIVTHADDCWLQGDPALLRSCVENIVRNAIRHTKAGSDVAISLDFSDDSQAARILIADQGDGVPPPALDHLFEPFYRVAAPQNDQTAGNGLGLSIAQRVVLLYGGTIVPRNREEGGLEIEICLPARHVQAI